MPKTPIHVTLDEDVYDYICHIAYLEQKKKRVTVSNSEVINNIVRKQKESEKKEG
jgi:hypothetical protein